MAGKTPILAYEAKYMRKWLGFEIPAFALMINKPQGYIKQVEDGEIPVSEKYINDIYDKFGYIPLSDHFKKSVSFTVREPLVTAVQRKEAVKRSLTTMFDLMG